MEGNKENNIFSRIAVTVAVAAICSLATYQITKNAYSSEKQDIKGTWYSSYAGRVFALELNKKNDKCKFGYEGQEQTECTYEYSNEVLRLKDTSGAGTNELIYSYKDNVLYIDSQPYYSSKEESNKNDAYYFVPEDYDVSMFTKITPEEFIKKFNDGEEMFVLSARGSCGYCQQFRPIAANSIKNYKYTLYYMDSAHVTDEEYEQITQLDPTLTESYASTPNVYYIKDKKVVDINEGATPEETYGAFLEKHGVKKVEAKK